jgi:predicted signal transduction protein with EAL and GGDEF domain
LHPKIKAGVSLTEESIMALFISLTATRLRRMLLVFFILASLFPVIMTLLVSFQYVLPVLGNAQIERLREVFNNTILAILLIQLLSFCLFWGWIKSWETLKQKISLISAEILKKKQTEELGENELEALHQLFQELQKEFKAVMGRLNEYFRRSITDDLTRLFNRNYFKFKLTEEVKRSEHLKQQLSLIAFSVDDFGLLEDGVGDKLLKDLGQLMRKVI